MHNYTSMQRKGTLWFCSKILFKTRQHCKCLFVLWYRHCPWSSFSNCDWKSPTIFLSFLNW